MSNEFSTTEGGAGSPPQAVTQSEIPNTPLNRAPALGDLKDKVADDLSATRDAIKETAGAAADKVKDVVAAQANFAARQVSGVAIALEKVGMELERADQPDIGRYAKHIGNSVQHFAKHMEGRDIGEVATMAEDFGRKQPLAFLGIAALAGLAASRFLTASSQRSTSTGSPAVPSENGTSVTREENQNG